MTATVARGQPVDRAAVAVLAHQLLAARQAPDEEEVHRQEQAVDTWTPTSSEITGTPGTIATRVEIDDHRRDQAHEDRCLLGPPADPLLEAEALGDDVGGGDRQDRRGEQAGAEQADPEEELGVLAGERLQRLGGVGGRADRVDAADVEGRAGGDDDEGGDEVGEDRPADRLARLGLQVGLGRPALDRRRLQVELHVGGDRRPRHRDEEEQEGGARVQLRDDQRVADLAPVGVGEDRRDRIGEEGDRQPDEDALGGLR